MTSHARKLHELHTQITIATSLRDSAPDEKTRAAREAALKKLTDERDQLTSAHRPPTSP